MGKVSKGLYLGSILGGQGIGLLLLLIGALTAGSSAQYDRGGSAAGAAAGGSLMCIGYLALIFGAVMTFVLIYKMWVAIQGPTARTTPGKAVGFLFIPFFNLYWIFQAYWGWAQDYNKFITTYGVPAKRAPEGLALTICILALLGWIPIVGLIVALVNLILFIVFFSAAIDGVNAIADSRTAQAGMAPPPPPQM